MSHASLFSFAAPVLAALALIQVPDSEAGARFEIPEGGARVPLTDWGGRPVVEVLTENDTALRLIVDTGAGAVLVLAKDAPEVLELRLGEARIVAPPAHRIEFPLGGAGAGERVDGILGIRAFDGHVIVFDFGAKRFELARGPLPADAPGAFAFRRDAEMGGILTIPARAAGVDIEAHLDTGSPGILLVPSELAARLPKRGEPKPAGSARTPMGGADIFEVELDGAVEVGTLRREDVRMRIGDLPQIAGKGIGNIGSGMFEGQRLTLDLASNRMRVEPSAPAPVEAGAPMGGPRRSTAPYRVGLAVTPSGDALEVRQVIPGGAGERAGLLAGDRIVALSVGGRDLPLAEAARAFGSPEPVEVTYVRDGRRAQTVVRPIAAEKDGAAGGASGGA